MEGSMYNSSVAAHVQHGLWLDGSLEFVVGEPINMVTEICIFLLVDIQG